MKFNIARGINETWHLEVKYVSKKLSAHVFQMFN